MGRPFGTEIHLYRECRRQTIELNTWANLKAFFHQSHFEQKRAVTSTYIVVYTVAVQNIYGILPPPPENSHGLIDRWNIIAYGIQTQSY